VIEKAGGKNAFDSVEGWKVVSFEQFMTTDPDCIIVNSGTGMTAEEGRDIIYDYFMTEPRMQDLSAVKENRVFIIDADIISRGGRGSWMRWKRWRRTFILVSSAQRSPHRHRPGSPGDGRCHPSVGAGVCRCCRPDEDAVTRLPAEHHRSITHDRDPGATACRDR